MLNSKFNRLSTTELQVLVTGLAVVAAFAQKSGVIDPAEVAAALSGLQLNMSDDPAHKVTKTEARVNTAENLAVLAELGLALTVEIAERTGAATDAEIAEWKREDEARAK